MTHRPSKTNPKHSTRGKHNNDDTSKQAKKSKHPRKVKEVYKEQQEQSSAMSTRGTKKGKKVSNAQVCLNLVLLYISGSNIMMEICFIFSSLLTVLEVQ